MRVCGARACRASAARTSRARERTACRGRGLVDEVGAFARNDVGQVVGLVVAVEMKVAVLVERVVELGVSPAGDVPFVPARRDVRRRHVGGLPVGVAAPGFQVAIQILAHQRGQVAGALQRDRERVLLLASIVERPKASLSPEVREHVRVVREVARQDRGPRRTAQRVRHEVIVERHPACLHRLDVRHVAKEVHRQVVRQHEHDVGAARTTNLLALRGQQHDRDDDRDDREEAQQPAQPAGTHSYPRRETAMSRL